MDRRPPSYSVELFAEDLHALVDALGLDRPVICGLSLGGAIAQVYATRYPDRLSGLVLAATFAPGYVDYRDWIQRSLMSTPPSRWLDSSATSASSASSCGSTVGSTARPSPASTDWSSDSGEAGRR